MVFTIIVAVFVLGVLIFVHESGHFLAAKLVGIQVVRFSIGLGKPIVSRQWGETEYSLAYIPFGGYVKMAGDDPVESLEGKTEEKEITTDPTRHFDKKGLFPRFLVIFSGPLANFLLAVVLYIGILYFQGAETYATTTIESVAEEELSLPGMEGIRPASRVLKVNGREVANWHDIDGLVRKGGGSRVVFELYDNRLQETYLVSVPAVDDSVRGRLADALVPLVQARLGEVVPGKP
ncbi:MAG: site-2 protease family protein, partial [Gemmatimonadota bacterium]|nr:site-2 protease family protein [Gemmatimonadota bacterium]